MSEALQSAKAPFLAVMVAVVITKHCANRIGPRPRRMARISINR